MATSFKRSHESTATLVPPALQQASTDPRLRWRLLDTHRQAWVRLFWGHCLFLLGLGAHKILSVPSKGLFPSPVSSGSAVVGFTATSSKRAYSMPKSAAPRAPALRQSTADLYLHRRCSNTAAHWRDQNRTHSSGKCTVVQTVKKMFNCWILLCHLFDPYQLECQLF